MLIPILKRATPIIKKELFYVFPYGPCTWLAGAFFVDRSSPKAAYKTLGHCAKEMHQKKVNLVDNFMIKTPSILISCPIPDQVLHVPRGHPEP